MAPSDPNPNGFRAMLEAELRLDEAASRSRILRSLPPGLADFGSNDYLGLSRHPAVTEAAAAPLREGRMGAGASRLLSGNTRWHDELEARLAAFKRCGEALLFNSGYAAALGTIPALLGGGDFVILDRLNHACLFDAARLSGAQVKVFDHNSLDQLESLLLWSRNAGRPDARILVVVESVYSMDGDFAPLAAIADLKDRFGAWLMVDEAHATGLFGAGRRGRCEAEDVAGRVEIQMGTLGKALGAAGGFIAGDAPLCALLRNRARSFLFTTALPASTAAAALRALELIEGGEGAALCARLWKNVAVLAGHLDARASGSFIQPLILGTEARVLASARSLEDQGFYVPAIRPPTVPKGEARLRISLSAAHREDEINRLAAALGPVLLPSA
jgi:8-amino-7-oxononanoate synthase